MKLWLDDIRPPPDADWVVARNDREFRTLFLALDEPWKRISFDNDLGLGSEEGWQLLNWVIDLVVSGRRASPVAMQVHSMNPIAKERMELRIQDLYTRICV